MSTVAPAPFLINISPDRMMAGISAKKGVDPYSLTVPDVIAALREVGIVLNDDVNFRVQTYVDLLHSVEGPPKGGFIIAAGVAADECVDARFELDQVILNDSNSIVRLPADHADYSDDEGGDFILVDPGRPLGKLIQAQPGRPGLNICGQVVPPRAEPIEIKLAEGVKLGPDGTTVYSQRSGRLVREQNTLKIRGVVEVSGDVNPSTGNIEAPADALVRGSIRDSVTVKVAGDLMVCGNIEVGAVEVVGPVIVMGGICNESRGKVTSNSHIKALYCDEADLIARGNVVLEKEATNSFISCEGRLLLPRGKLCGGAVYARQSIEVAGLGSRVGIPTRISVGMSPGDLLRIRSGTEERDERRVTVRKMRQTVKPLLARLHSLTSTQRERATQLLFKAEELEEEIKAFETQLIAPLDRSREEKPHILVSGRLYPNVTITIDDRVATITEPLQGPLRLERRRTRDQVGIVAVYTVTGFVHELPGKPLQLESPLQEAELAEQ